MSRQVESPPTFPAWNPTSGWDPNLSVPTVVMDALHGALHSDICLTHTLWALKAKSMGPTRADALI